MATFPFAPVAGPGGFPLPPGPGTVLARIEDAVRETANDVMETITGNGRASGTNAVTVTSASGAQGTATLDENVVTVDEYNAGMESLAKRIAKLAGQVAQIRTGMLAQNAAGASAQGWDGAMSWEQYQAQQGGNGMNTWMPLMLTLLLTKNGTGSTSLDPTTLALIFMMPGMSNGNGGQNMMMPLLLITLLKK